MRTYGYLAFLAGLCVTAAACLAVGEAQEQQLHAHFQRDSDKVARDTNVRLQIYFDMLLSIKGVYAIDGQVSRAQFGRYVRELNLTQRYPGFQAIQFVRVVPAAALPSYVDAVRADTSVEPGGYPYFKIHPAAIRDVHYVIDYNEPMTGNEHAFGLDLAALPPHRAALEFGAETGKVIATERITLVQDASGQPGFVARTPVYRPGMALDTAEQRRAALSGFVAIVFRVENLMREVVDAPLLSQLHIRIHDAGYLRDGGAAAPAIDNVMYDSAGKIGALRPAQAAALPQLTSRIMLNVGERRWVMRFDGLDGARYGSSSATVMMIAGAGFLISTLIAALLFAWQRRRALAETLHRTLTEQRALQDSAIVGIGLFSADTIMGCNRGLEEMMDYPQGGLAGLPSSVLVPADERGRPAANPFHCDRSGRRAHAEMELVRRDGSRLWCMVNGKVLDMHDASKGCVWVINDISDRKRAEAALVDTKLGLERSLDELAAQKASAELAHHDLSAVLATLRLAQNNLITSEKMASLGALVAGIAHELNTPIGNSLLTATALSDMVTEFEHKLADGGIKRSTLDAHLKDVRTACAIMGSSLGRAADLITSFKQVAVDQASDQRRSFRLADVLHDTLATFAAQLRRANCDVRLDVPEQLTFDSYPGSVSQVLSNLINNAMLHAFEGRSSGTITIRARAMTQAESGEQGLAQLVFCDDGVGMSARTLHQVFDPFFTTKMGQGGSGLGMNIVYNIVTGVLRGSIAIESQPGGGTTITLVLPLRVPEQDDAALAVV